MQLSDPPRSLWRSAATHLKRSGDLRAPNESLRDVGYDLPAAQDYDLGPYLKTPTQYIHDVLLDRPGYAWRVARLLWARAFTVHPPHFTAIKTGIHVRLPDGMWATMIARSSANVGGLLVPPCVIDTGYVGQLYPLVYNLNNTPVHITKGQRVAQLVLHAAYVFPMADMQEVDFITTRGYNGFGSTGK